MSGGREAEKQKPRLQTGCREGARGLRGATSTGSLASQRHPGKFPKVPPGGEGNAHSSILAWRISWTEEPGGLQAMGLHTEQSSLCCRSLLVIHVNL